MRTSWMWLLKSDSICEGSTLGARDRAFIRYWPIMLLGSSSSSRTPLIHSLARSSRLMVCSIERPSPSISDTRGAVRDSTSFALAIVSRALRSASP